jgi:hypothetical protein
MSKGLDFIKNKPSNKNIIIFICLFLVMGCQGQKTFQQKNTEELNQVPANMEIPESADDGQIDPTLDQFPSDQVSTPANTTNPPSTSSSDETLQPSVPSVIENRPSPFKPPRGHKPQIPGAPNKPVVRSNDILAPTPEGPSQFIQIAMWVIKNESRKIGTACNFYVSRVLEIAGYSDDSFIANDFDLYAKRNFSSAETESYDTNNVAPERQRLKSHLWSYPERTPFIFNWERLAGQHGHIAIVERIGNQLVIFQANMGKYLPQRGQTTIENLISFSKKAKLTVYANFRP